MTSSLGFYTLGSYRGLSSLPVCIYPSLSHRPAKYFSIDRVFRNEQVDRTHLAEFHQVEGVEDGTLGGQGALGGRGSVGGPGTQEPGRGGGASEG